MSYYPFTLTKERSRPFPALNMNGIAASLRPLANKKPATFIVGLI